MKKLPLHTLALLLAGATMFTGCGQKGPLYIDRDLLARQQLQELEEDRREAEQEAQEEAKEKEEKRKEQTSSPGRELRTGPEIEYIDGLPVYR